MRKIWDRLSCERVKLEKHYKGLYGVCDHSQEVKRVKAIVYKRYGLVILASFFLSAAVIAGERLEARDGPITAGKEIISIKRPSHEDGPAKVRAKVTAGLGDESLTQNLTLVIRPEFREPAEDAVEAEDEAGGHAQLEKEIRNQAKLINMSDAGDEVRLPGEIAGGVKLKWEGVSKSNLPTVAIVFAAGLLTVFKTRYGVIKKEEKRARESIITELPEFINQLVLLLNAGLVLTAAFSRIMQGIKSEEVKSYFYLQLLRLDRNMQETNSPLTEELRDFARRSGVKEMMRLSNIISDNVDKGAGLVEKLQAESQILWFTKKKNAEEMGRLAETKMTFPLVLLLLVLIMVTITPALMEM